MNRLKSFFMLSLMLSAPGAFSVTTDIIIYSRGFAAVQDSMQLNIVSGNNEIRFTDIASAINPSSVIVLDAETQKPLVVTELKYISPAASENLMLSKFEGKEIEFLCGDKIIKGKIILSTPLPCPENNNAVQRPIVEIEGKLRFGLPGQPLFALPPNTLDTYIKPALKLNISSDKAVKHTVILNYITEKISWKADYNLIISERNDNINLIGQVTVNNQSGKSFKDVNVRLVNGEINRIKNGPENKDDRQPPELPPLLCKPSGEANKSAQNYIYRLASPANLPDGEQKQLDFIRASGISFKKMYVCPGENFSWDLRDIIARNGGENGNQEKAQKIRAFAVGEFENSEKNCLGMPLPSGNMHFYMLKTDGRLEFIGENPVEHIPAGGIIKIEGSETDEISAEKKRTELASNRKAGTFSETLEIKLSNKKTDSAEVKVVEKLIPELNWKIVSSSEPFVKKDPGTIEFNTVLPPSSEKTISYKVLYTE